MKTLAIIVAALCVAEFASSGAQPSKTYRVGHGSIDVDGALDEVAWTEAVSETGFSFPWQEREAPATEFRALMDDTNFYFAFRVEDADIVIDDGGDEEAVARGDRVELFFTLDPSLDDYVCFEIDPSGRVLDYRASYYRELDFEWDLPSSSSRRRSPRPVMSSRGASRMGRCASSGFRRWLTTARSLPAFFARNIALAGTKTHSRSGSVGSHRALTNRTSTSRPRSDGSKRADERRCGREGSREGACPA